MNIFLYLFNFEEYFFSGSQRKKFYFKKYFRLSLKNIFINKDKTIYIYRKKSKIKKFYQTFTCSFKLNTSIAEVKSKYRILFFCSYSAEFCLFLFFVNYIECDTIEYCIIAYSIFEKYSILRFFPFPNYSIIYTY